MTSMDGSITEYVCAYGNNGNYQRRKREILSKWEYQNTLHIWRPTTEKDIGFVQTLQQ